MENLTEQIKKALLEDFRDLYVKGFTEDWQVQRLVRALEIKVMNVHHLEDLFTKIILENSLKTP